MSRVTCHVSRVTSHVSAAGEVKDPSGLTIEGLQEFYDEACLAVLNNKYQDGIQWHDVPCYFRWVVELSTNLREVSQCRRRPLLLVTRAFF